MNAHSKSRTRAAPSLRERLKEATHAAILDAAENVFARDGVQTARMEDVASAAGVAVGTLYNYFGDRSALLAALLDARRAELLARLDAVLEDRAPSFERRLQAFLSTTIEHFEHHLGLFRLHMEAELVLREKRDPRPLRAVLERTERLFKEGVASGALHSEDVELYPALLIGMLRGLFMRQIYGNGPPPTADAAERVARIFLRGAGKDRR